ncbi:hypothetical protein Zm00014a_008112 [Zea mays]|uniref:Putative disease resistance protein RGA1 n=1 Tax=Zea mays TaxID=4577 RepID=A0A3L6FZD8_MAIZE|nr:hypothetical protein Zm00014a_008112 [Zea mays]PWZ40165.1 hypothetical protein Zm00014a_008112 [Zea mays]PWZ40166.1 putative disease resistance protein RGA1 [Zea mays]PWZ40167.1 hypothetical protein Zm00014a_008112 [Zea mays]
MANPWEGNLLAIDEVQGSIHDRRQIRGGRIAPYSQAYKKGLTLFTMHDLVHDLARLLTAGEILDASNIGTMDVRHVAREPATRSLFHGYMNAKSLFRGFIRTNSITYRYWRRREPEGSRQQYKYALLTNCHKSLEVLMDSPNTIRALHFRDCHGSKGLKDYAFLHAKLSLKVLDLSGCNIAYLPASIGELAVLRYLNAPEIKNEMLPDSLSKLSKLIYLNLSGSNISALPDSIGDIEGLMHLDISNCVLLCELPESFMDLKNLVYLDLSHCQIKITARVFSGLTNIQHLNLSKSLIHGGDGLEGLQEAVGGLTELRYLNLSGCFENLRPDEVLSFVDRICRLTNLVHLDLSFNLGLVSVPESIGSLRKLHTLDLLCCRNLVTLPKCMLNMDSMKILNVTCCPNLDQSTLPRYRYFTLPYFEVHAAADESTSNIGLLRYVNPTHELYISGLDNTMSAEEVDSINLSQKQGIQSLSLSWTRDAQRSVEDMEVLGKLVPPDTLKCFELRGYDSMSFPTWVMGITLYLPRLTKVVLWELRKCNSLPPLGQLPTLQKLVMGGMDSTLTIEEGFCCAGPGAFPLLQELQLCQMENLEVWNTTYSCGQNNEDVQEFMFRNLRELLIRDCPKLRLKPCPPKTVGWKIENSDNVLSSWDEEGDIDLAALFPSRKEFKKLWEGKIKVPAACSAHFEKCRKPGASYNACPERVEVKSSKLPLGKWRLFRHLLPTYDLRISCCTYATSGSSQEIIQGLAFIESLCLEDDAQSELPNWLGELTSLETLEISKYPGLEAPLDGMKQLAHLRKLSLINCRSMSALPQWLGELISLKELIISEWPNLSDFPESMQLLTSLKMLRLERCPRITALPGWLGDLASLKILVISNCKGIVSLPEGIQKITRLVRV